MGAQQKWNMTSRVADKRERKAEAEAHWRKVCAAVTRRDAGHCRICGRRCDPFATAMLQRGEHHHIVYRSANGPDETSNVILVCKGCHDDEHAGRIQVKGDGDLGIEIWRRGEDDELYLSVRETPHGIERD